jgi:hypothetical protein
MKSRKPKRPRATLSKIYLEQPPPSWIDIAFSYFLFLENEDAPVLAEPKLTR